MIQYSNAEMHIHEDRLSLSRNIRLVCVFAFLTVVCVPFMTIDIGGIGILLITGIPMLAVSVVPIFKKGKISLTKEKGILFSFLAYQVVGYIWSSSFDMHSMYTFVKVLIVILCLYCIRFNNDEKKALIIASSLSCILICFFILTGSRSIAYVEGRATISVFGASQDPNYIAYAFFFAFAVCFSNTLSNKRVVIKAFSAIGAILIFICVLMTGSRGSWVSIIALAAALMLHKSKRIWRTVLYAALAFLIVVYLYPLLLSLIPGDLAKRFTIDYIMHNGGSNRLYLWTDVINLMKENPHRLLFGYGTGSSVAVTTRATHNYILQLLLEGGIISVILFLRFTLYWIKKLWHYDSVCFSVFVASIVMAMTLSVNTSYYFWVTFILCTTCHDIEWKRYKPSENGEEN